jgi:hypothetical protein
MVLRHKSFALLFCFVIGAGLYEGRQQVDADERPAALILYPNATSIQSDQQGSSDRLSYHVSSKFPAAPVIDWISDELQKAGWEPLKYDFLNPNSPSSQVTGWTYFLDGRKSPAPCVHQWLGDWKDAPGNIVRYGFRYVDQGCSTLALTDLEVDVWYIPTDLARQTQQNLEKWKKDGKLQTTSEGSQSPKGAQ